MSGEAPQRIIDVAAGLVFRDGRLLITQRPAGSHLAGLWEFPGGKREPGETFFACLQRELHEELGCAVEVQQLVDAVTHHYPEKSVHLRFYRCRLIEGEPRPLGCTALAWVKAEEFGQYEFPPADARLLELLQRSPHLWSVS